MTGTGLSMWVIYDHPKDIPDGYVARLWDESGRPTGSTVQSKDLEVVRGHMLEMGLTAIGRSPEDDAVIMEVWL